MPDPLPQTPPPPKFRGLILLAFALAIVVWGIASRLEAETALKRETQQAAAPKVAVMQAARGPSSEEIVLPGSVQAWHEAAIYARTSGYVKDWLTDIGAHVKEGDLLAEIETPEVDAQMHQAEADLATAEANNKLAQSTAQRWDVLLKTKAVSKQEAEEKFGDAAAKEALVLSAKANLDRLKQLEEFKRITAPFDGVITARNIDTGALINAGSGGTGPELFHIAETGKLRVYIQVPEADAPFIKSDLVADLRLAEHPQESFAASLAHTADAIDPASRTLLVELEVDNAEDKLLPGSYTQVHIKLPSDGTSVRLPVNTLLFRADGMQVATVDANGKAMLKLITIGRDYGKEVEVTSGISEGETIIINPPDSLSSGQVVQIAAFSAKTDKKP
jgi:RND family efflux transporter MFP subunit